MQTTRLFALQLLARLCKYYGMGCQARLLLEVAATVRAIGSTIATHKHYAHSNTIICASAIMGLNALDVTMVALITRFHSSVTPQSDLCNFPIMSTENRLVVAKLSAIYWVADSLDASRQQCIQRMRVSLCPDMLVLSTCAKAAIALARWTLARMRAFFSEVFGVGLAQLRRNTLSNA